LRVRGADNDIDVMAKWVDQRERHERAAIRVHEDAKSRVPTPCGDVFELFGTHHDTRVRIAKRWARFDELILDEKPEAFIGLGDSNAPDLPAA